jgi:acetylornithine deacetylase/succinyl-diaminopimelate desuccinylase-like protein
MSTVVKHIRGEREAYLDQLSQLLSIPSISTGSEHGGDVRRAARWVSKKLKAAGCKRVEVYDTPRHPIVYGEWLGAAGAPTLLVYGHYDVQPVDPLDLWDNPPFEPLVRDGRIYARGASDNKGQFLAHIEALEAHLAVNGSCPVNVKFLIEGEEEIGSPHLDRFMADHLQLLACDAVVVSDTAMFAKGLPSICYGLRGLAYLEVHVRGTSQDLHSGTFGGSVINPANALVEMLAALKDSKGRITVPGVYEKVRRIRPAERREFASLPHSDAKYKRSVGAPALHGEAGYSTLERVWVRPALDINGIWAGFTGEGAKTVIPAEAHAKISMRLVPDQSPKRIARKLGAYLKKIAPPAVRVTVRDLHGGDSWVAPTDHPALHAAGRALRRAFGRKPVFVREGGSIPIVADFDRRLKVPAVLMGLGLNDDNLHAPNEKMDLDNFYLGIEASAFFMEEMGGSVAERRGPSRAGAKKRR